MLGNGCPWRGSCKAEKSSGFQGQYCNSDTMSRKCPHRPMNSGNEKISQDYSQRKGTHETTHMGQVIIVIVLLIIIASFVLPKIMG